MSKEKETEIKELTPPKPEAVTENVMEMKGELVKVDKELVDIAFNNYTHIVQRRNEVQKSFLELGRLLKECRDKELYKVSMNCGSFEEFVATPEVSMGYSTVYSLIKIYERYVLQLKIPTETLAVVGHRRLQIINPVVEEDPPEWVSKALSLSRSDLRNEVRSHQKKPEIKFGRAKKEKRLVIDYKDYEAYVLAYGCLLRDCARPSESAHFPRTRGAGAPDYWIIPLCRMHHEEMDGDLIDFWVLYKDQIMQYFYETIAQAFAILKDKTLTS